MACSTTLKTHLPSKPAFVIDVFLASRLVGELPLAHRNAVSRHAGQEKKKGLLKAQQLEECGWDRRNTAAGAISQERKMEKP